MTSTLLGSPLARSFEIVHVDTSDRRGVRNIGRLDVGNVRLALVHGVRFATTLVRSRAEVVYVPVSQNTLGFARDALFLVPALLWGVPIVLHLHGGGYGDFVRTAPGPVRWLLRLVFGRATRVIVLGESLRAMLGDMTPAERIAVIPNGVADTGARTAARVPDGTMRILYLGNLIPGKGYVELLEAVQTLLDEGLDVAVTFAGGIADGGVHERALASVRYGEERIRFAGTVEGDAKRDLLATADVLALPSYYDNEAHPLVLLEAMASGLPVVSTRHAAIPEIVADGESGILIEPRSVSGLVTALRRLTEHPAERRAMGNAGRRRYEEMFTIERWTERMAELLESAVASPR
jgi:glycosyltransferase involved in cell wall biosynthesis